MEFNFYARELGYSIVERFYFQETKTEQFKLLKNDSQLLGLLVSLKNENVLDIFIKHVVDNSTLMKNGVPTESIETDLNANSLGVDIGGSDLNDSNTDEDLEGIPDEDDSDVDEELRRFSIEKNRQVYRQIAGDEEYLDNSDVDSDDSKDELDSQAEIGVDLPSRRQSKKVRYDSDCKVVIFELGMIFESFVVFWKAVADYAIQNKAQLKLRPNEKQRVGETKHSWSWFINYLILDLELGQGDGLNVMSDMQKGLVPVLKSCYIIVNKECVQDTYGL
ncbi:hypothetical protein HAX54_029441 [Datura stramonium]|uniref:Uncharacterized protein n=1 Tax=Datura stramonium TaxID=4076 RepID=A0ABS8V5Y2_DATST|nr:hypothetical protein [Datura stramonium]